VILSCEASLATTRQFCVGFSNVCHTLKPPIVLIDQSGSSRLSAEYLSLVISLSPQVVYVHPAVPDVSRYDSVQEAANLALQLAYENSKEDDYILFLEDDLAFSSRFADKVVNTYLGPETGFLTLYMPDNGYGFHIVDPSHFYGSQCLLFTRKAVGEIVTHREYMMSNFLPGYDIRWSRFLGSRGYTLYCADYSYVQHLPVDSRLHNDGSSHRSNRFIP
jgi:hypothetical protein